MIKQTIENEVNRITNTNTYSIPNHYHHSGTFYDIMDIENAHIIKNIKDDI